ncbi:hypothetical protein ABPG72_009565 [Tetrahymena utriculariae]
MNENQIIVNNNQTNKQFCLQKVYQENKQLINLSLFSLSDSFLLTSNKQSVTSQILQYLAKVNKAGIYRQLKYNSMKIKISFQQTNEKQTLIKSYLLGFIKK